MGVGTATLVTKGTNLEPWIGVRVKIERTVRGERYTYYGIFESLFHWKKETSVAGIDYCGGMLREQRHDGSRVSDTGFDLQYGDATLELAPLDS